MESAKFYHPVERGLEIKIADKLRELRNKNKQAGQ
jgi:replication-associated recombination protein RarA